MIDAIAIFCSTVCVIYVLIHTAIIDRTTPWFEEEGATGEAAGTDRNSGSGAGASARRAIHR